MEESLLLLKPDAQERGLTDDILGWVKQSFNLKQAYIAVPSRELILEHYVNSIRRHGDFLAARLVEYLTSGPVISARISGMDAVDRLRTLCGVEGDPSLCPESTIRGHYGIDSYAQAQVENRGVRNLVHSSDSITEAKREIEELWYGRFRPAKPQWYLGTHSPWFL